MLKTLLGRFALEREGAAATRVLEEAVRAREAGDLASAECLARDAMQQDPGSLDSRLLLADIVLESGNAGKAVRVARAAVAAFPESADAREVFAAALRAAGEPHKAEAALLEASRLDPERLNPRNTLAALLIERGQFEEAIGLLRWVLKREPDRAEVQANLAVALHMRRRTEKALEHFNIALGLKPDDSTILSNYALCLRDLDRLDEAEGALRRALTVAPDAADPLVNLANVLREANKPIDCLPALQSLVDREPRNAEARSTLAKILQDRGDIDGAARELDAAIAARPDSDDTRLARAMHLLARGDFERGWPEYEARLAASESPQREFSFPDWDGGPFSGKSVLVYAEQGFGDEIMFASCFPDLIAQAGRCVIECDPRLARLFAASFPGAAVFGGRHAANHPWLERAGPIDIKVAMGSLPLAFRREGNRFPAHSGYLHADPARVAHYRERLATLGSGRKIGIAWRGGVAKTRRIARSVAPAAWAPILEVPGLQFVSVQHGPVADDLAAFAKEGLRLPHWQEVHEDAAELAALMTALDAVVSVCSACVHLGGALGRPVLVLTPASPEWRYLLEGSRMPWYPSVRLFRQRHGEGWERVIGEVAKALEGLDAGGAGC